MEALLGHDLFITIVDKGLLALVLALTGYWLKRRLHEHEARADMLEAIASHRVTSYRALWQLTQRISYSLKSNPTLEQRSAILDELSSWYYSEAGGALFLSAPAAELYGLAREALVDDERTLKGRQDAFSALRTQLKADLGIYVESDMDIQTINPQKALMSASSAG